MIAGLRTRIADGADLRRLTTYACSDSDDPWEIDAQEIIRDVGHAGLVPGRECIVVSSPDAGDVPIAVLVFERYDRFSDSVYYVVSMGTTNHRKGLGRRMFSYLLEILGSRLGSGTTIYLTALIHVRNRCAYEFWRSLFPESVELSPAEGSSKIYTEMSVPIELA